MPAPATSTSGPAPRRLLLYQNCRHGLDNCRDEIDRDLLAWIREVVDGTVGASGSSV